MIYMQLEFYDESRGKLRSIHAKGKKEGRNREKKEGRGREGEGKEVRKKRKEERKKRRKEIMAEILPKSAEKY